MEQYVPIEQRAIRATAALALAAGAVIMPAVVAEAAPNPHATVAAHEAHDPYNTSVQTSHGAGVEFPFPSVTTKVQATDPRPYARQFAHSAADVLQVSPSEVEDVIDAINSPMMVGGSKVTIRGWASAEDDAWRPYAGTLTPNAQNQELATKRGQEYMKTLAAALNAKPHNIHKDGVLQAFTKDGVTVNLLPGKEQQLTQAQAHNLDTFAHQHGYADARRMVIAYDADQTSGAVTKQLDQTLARSRKVEVTVEAELPVPIAAPTMERLKDDSGEQYQDPAQVTNTQKPNPMPIGEIAAAGIGLGLAIGAGAAFKKKFGSKPGAPQVEPVHPVSPQQVPEKPDRFKIVA